MELRPIPKSLLDREWKFKDVKEQGEHEQKYAEAKDGWLVHDPLTDSEKRYLLVTTLPWTSKGGLAPLLSYMWQPWGCVRCSTVMRDRWAVPSGRMDPKYLVVGEAPGASIKGRPDYPLSRAWTYGKAARILRKATAMAGIYWDCWFTNLIKCPVEANRRPNVQEEASCQMYLVTELRALQPEVIILLGKHVQQSFPAVQRKVVKVNHPSYYARKGSLARAMAKDLVVALEEVGSEPSAAKGSRAEPDDKRAEAAAAEWDGRSPLGS